MASLLARLMPHEKTFFVQFTEVAENIEAAAHALESWMSNGQSRKSTSIDRLTASSSGAGPPAKRPPQSLCDFEPSECEAGISKADVGARVRQSTAETTYLCGIVQ